MPCVSIMRQCDIKRTARVMQAEGLFDVPEKSKEVRTWDVELPLQEKDWHIGLIVGPSGCGKSVIASEMFKESIVEDFEWSEGQSVIDAFPSDMGIKDITGLLSSVGFSSPPAWLKPFHVLSNGERFRVNIARVLAEKRDLAVVDEFTSVVDRTVAQIGSAAVAKTIRKRGQRFIAVTCHYDVEEWLQPDWVYCPVGNSFEWRFLQQRPEIKLDILRVHYSAWNYFKDTHYLTGNIHRAARCYMALWDNRPVAFAGFMAFPHVHVKNAYRGHRLVCLPDFQGVGIGSTMSQFSGMLCRGAGKRFYIRSSHPAEKRHVVSDKNWRVVNQPKAGTKTAMGRGIENRRKHRVATVNKRIYRPVLSAEYVGPGYPAEEAQGLWNAQPVRLG